MKILYLKLVNSAGIYAAMNKRTIEIEFNNPNKIIMIQGANGSGKTTILSSLNPFVDTVNDERKNFFIKNSDGEKVIHYKIDDKVYMIKHYIKNKKTSSYISEIDYNDYINKKFTKANELNENGGVRTFEDLVLKYLNVDKEYFKISRIGTNVTNFIDLSTSNRKKYISNFLPNIDEYLKRYKVINERYKLINKDIKYVSDLLLKLEDINSLNSDKINTEKEIKDINTKIKNTNKTITECKLIIKSIDNDYNNKLSENKFKNFYKEKYNSYKDSNLYYDENELNNYNENINKYKIDLINLNNELNNLIEKENNEKQNFVNNINKRNDIENQLNNLNSSELDSLIEMKNKNLNNINKLKELINNFNIKQYDYNNEDKNEINFAIRRTLEIINYISENIISEYNKDLIIKSINNNYTMIQINNIYKLKENSIKDITNFINELNNKKSTLESHYEDLEILNKRPNDCKDDNCPFIKKSLKYKNLKQEISDIESLIKENKEKLVDENKYLDNIKFIKEFYSYLNNNIKLEELNLILKLIKRNKINSLWDFVNLIINESNINNFYSNIKNINTLFDYFHNKEELIQEESYINMINNRINDLEKIKLMEDNLKKDLNNIEIILFSNKDIINDLNNKINNIKNEIEEDNFTIKKYNNLIEIMNENKEKLDNFNNIKESYEKLEKDLSVIKNQSIILKEKVNEEKELQYNLDLLNKKLDTIKINISKYKEYKERKNNLEKDYKLIELIKKSIDPTKGIPVYYIDKYLNKTKEITNNLLDISQKGKFAINFNINEKDFYIQVYKDNGDILDDIIEASQGETALTKLSLSLALMEQKLEENNNSGYNIITIDEIDGPLDAKNRRYFIETIEKQANILNSEQVFVISHNKEFETLDIDFILLKGYDSDINNKKLKNRIIEIK